MFTPKSFILEYDLPKLIFRAYTFSNIIVHGQIKGHHLCYISGLQMVVTQLLEKSA